ncbi:unnamed protein product [Chrysodeixis includens]|uniref:DH domain-containing protein n=1 Tax=Chrysodeixis includens TaxID=689277 RepID=A0A9P0BKN5_CHRIL|nr:unnamed protein product [Chrysodeixis includens]
MDRFRQKSKKEKPTKYVGKDQSPMLTDVKSIQENMKIKEILRTVKMNSSMRIKAPRGSKVMQNKDFIDNEDIFEKEANSENMEHPNATNPNVVLNSNCVEINENEADDKTKTSENNEEIEDIVCESNDKNSSIDITVDESATETEDVSNVESITEEDKQIVIPDVKIDLPPPSDVAHVKTRDRKLSLDQTMLTRREGLSQSELDLNSIGKSPLERKSSFFRKTMDSFLKNTTEYFKRQSLSRSQSIQRRGSMSMSLQSLNENTVCNGDYGKLLHKHQEELQGSATSLQSSLTAAESGGSSMSKSHSERTLPDPQSEGDSLAGSFPILSGSQPLGDTSSQSVLSLNEAYIQESLLNSRAISMSSGLDAAHGQSRRQKSRSNRVTWLASEGLTNYLRRVIQDEKSREREKEFSTIPENNPSGPKTDSKGRRLSYQRAVSGEDPRYLETLHRRKQLILENSEPVYELPELLAEYTRHGVPALKGWCIADIPADAFHYLKWAQNPENLGEVCDWKKLPPAEESRQAVIKELITTEADYIRHLKAIVEVFIATAHALQDAGKLLEVDTENLFTNIPDVLNASLLFWESTLFPMIIDAIEKRNPFDSEIMSPGFMQFRELFHPYEKYVNEQTKALDYLRSLSGNQEFQAYLNWCHSQSACNRLQLSDIMVKPMQRLTKYSLILKRLLTHTDTEPERTSLEAMMISSKSYVQDINRAIRQKEELERMERLCNTIECFEIEFKDEDMDRCFHLYTAINLKSAMINCASYHSRTLIHEGDVRFKDNLKEFDVRAFLLTDMMLICKKTPGSKSGYPYKLIRPKFMIDKLVTYTRGPRTPKESGAIIFVVLDDYGSAQYAFALSDVSKEQLSAAKVWEHKLREARLTYELALWYTKHPDRDVSEMDADSSSEAGATRGGVKLSSEDAMIEREARERVAAMLHRLVGTSTDCDVSQASMNTDSFDGGDPSMSARPPGIHSLRHPMKRNSTGGSSRNSRLSSFQQSTSAASHDEPQPGPSRYYRAGSSVEHVIPPLNENDGVMSITVNVVSESESETMVHTQQAQPPIVVLQHSSPHKTPVQSRSSSTSRNTLRVQPQNVVMALVHSLPDLTIDPSPTPPRPQQSPSPQSASEKLYQSHQELLNRNRLSARQHYLSPDHRGTSYPPPSPTRASLKRGLAFSYSFKNPPLSKMGHVNSQSQVQVEAGPSTSQAGTSKGDGSPQPGPSGENKKGDKKSKSVSSRQKGSSASPSSRKEDKSD